MAQITYNRLNKFKTNCSNCNEYIGNEDSPLYKGERFTKAMPPSAYRYKTKQQKNGICIFCSHSEFSNTIRTQFYAAEKLWNKILTAKNYSRQMTERLNPISFEGKIHKDYPLQRLVGIELEINNVARTRKSSPKIFEIFNEITSDMNDNEKWGIIHVDDPSISYLGREFIFPPASGTSLVEMLTHAYKILKKNEAQSGPNCAIHVHVDARDLSPLQIKTFCGIYAAIELDLMQLVAPWRRQTRFAYSCRDLFKRISEDTSTNKDFLLPYLYNTHYFSAYLTNKENPNLIEVPTYRLNKRVGESPYYGEPVRQMAVNLHSWYYRKTLEFRQFEADLSNPLNAIKWSAILATMVNLSGSCWDKICQRIVDKTLFKRILAQANATAWAEKRKQILTTYSTLIDSEGDDDEVVLSHTGVRFEHAEDMESF